MCFFQIHEIYALQWTLIKQYCCFNNKTNDPILNLFKLVHFSKKLGRLSSAGAEIQAYVSHCSAIFQSTLDCFIPNFKLKYEDSKNIKSDRINTVIFNLDQIKRRAFSLGHPVVFQVLAVLYRW